MTIPTTQQKQERPLRAGTFATVADADEAVKRLRAAGFSIGEITVICSDEAKERHFPQYEHQEPAGSETPVAAAAVGTFAAVVGGLVAAGAGLAVGGVPLLVAGGAGVLTGGVAGGFLGAMLTRGVEKEPADYYDQAVVKGDLLVVAEAHGDDADARLAQAEAILATAGANPVPLSEG